MFTKYLTQYLNAKFFLLGSYAPQDVVNDMSAEFGVDVKVEPHFDSHLYIFKYNMLTAQWLKPLTHECRGIILRPSKDGWEIMSYPFNKFFNQHEGHCSISKKEDFDKSIPELEFVEKADGTCIQVWFDRWNDAWRVSTLGAITTLPIHDSGITFDTLFWNTVGGHSIEADFVRGNTNVFELCGKLNRVVTRYPNDRVYILGIRQADNTFVEQETIKNLNYVKSGKIHVPKRAKLSDIGITSLEDAQAWIEKQVADISTYGEYAEGFVLYDKFGPSCKMKNSVYLALHHSLSDSACTLKAVIHSLFSGTMDDLYAALPEEYQKFADKLKTWLNEYKVHLNVNVAPKFRTTPFATRKDYALFVQALSPKEKQFQTFFFSDQKGICDQNVDLGELFISWILQNHEKYYDYWKSMKD
jgi:hypothetical protein